jgi:hypothetical protein
MEIVMKYCARGPLGLMALAWPKLHGPTKLALRPGLLGLAAHARSRGEAPMARRRRWPLIPVAGGMGRRGNRSGITAVEWGPDLRGRGRRGAHQSSAPHGGVVGRGGSLVRGHRRVRAQSLHRRRGSPGRGGAHGGEGAAIPWPEVPVGVEALSAVRRRAEAGERGTRRRNRGASL